MDGLIYASSMARLSTMLSGGLSWLPTLLIIKVFKSQHAWPLSALHLQAAAGLDPAVMGVYGCFLQLEHQAGEDRGALAKSSGEWPGA